MAETHADECLYHSFPYPGFMGCTVVAGRFLVLAFAIIGLHLTLINMFRGDQEPFKVAFIIVIVLAVLLFLRSVFYWMACFIHYPWSMGTAVVIATTVNILIVITNVIAFALLLYALIIAVKVPRSHKFGCYDGFGCANIFGIMVAIFCAFSVINVSISIANTLINGTPDECFPIHKETAKIEVALDHKRRVSGTGKLNKKLIAIV